MKIDHNDQATRAALVTIVNDIDAYGPEPALELLLERLEDPESDVGFAKAMRHVRACQKLGLKPEQWIEYFDITLALAASVTSEQQLREGFAELFAEFVRRQSH